MSKHTPGPWRVENLGPHWNNPDITNFAICWSVDGERVVDHVYEEADANLIAAAPELLEALVAMRTMMDAGAQPRKLDEALSWRENDNLARRLCDEAIAKATGESA